MLVCWVHWYQMVPAMKTKVSRHNSMLPASAMNLFGRGTSQYVPIV